MFDSGNNNSSDSKANASLERRLSREVDPRNLPRGVYGVSVKQNSLEKSSSEDCPDDDDEVSSVEILNIICTYASLSVIYKATIKIHCTYIAD